MKNSKHTPGPWVIETYHGSLFKICKPDFKVGDEAAPRLEADAALISAAPEMLAVLDRVLLGVDTTEEIRDIIAKARGE